MKARFISKDYDIFHLESPETEMLGHIVASFPSMEKKLFPLHEKVLGKNDSIQLAEIIRASEQSKEYQKLIELSDYLEKSGGFKVKVAGIYQKERG